MLSRSQEVRPASTGPTGTDRGAVREGISQTKAFETGERQVRSTVSAHWTRSAPAGGSQPDYRGLITNMKIYLRHRLHIIREVTFCSAWCVASSSRSLSGGFRLFRSATTRRHSV